LDEDKKEKSAEAEENYEDYLLFGTHLHEWYKGDMDERIKTEKTKAADDLRVLCSEQLRQVQEADEVKKTKGESETHTTENYLGKKTVTFSSHVYIYGDSSSCSSCSSSSSSDEGLYDSDRDNEIISDDED